ncbi:hypothetical protein RND81_11G162200 [Saponaria officinalis]|uniref:B-like cyclin n=1 Tax=Saponaria officinalis TaxID=3572 RepID=A0AAW1HMY3_SAPOF
MAILFPHEQEQNPSSLLDTLYCEEEEEKSEEGEIKNEKFIMFSEDDELQILLSKEIKEGFFEGKNADLGRKEGVEWMLKVNTLYGFNALTSILSVNYFDRFISKIPFIIQNAKPWSIQLVAVACVSIAAKVEETHVPLLLQLQVEGAKPMFEPKDVQKMEVLVLSALEWKMHPITPLSFLHHLITRLGLIDHLHFEFLRRCEGVLLSLLSDWRYGNYLPSVLATATMMHVIDLIHSSNSLDYHTQLLHVLNFTKEKVNDCYEMIMEKSSRSTNNKIDTSKRKFEQMITNSNTTTYNAPSSPIGVVDAYYFSSDSSNDSWETTTTNIIGQSSSSVSSSSSISRKTGRVYEQSMTLPSKVFLDV